jgi:hypothetical protein
MATITPDQIKVLDFGYLTGADLMAFCSWTLLANQWQINNDNLQAGCDFAYAEVTGKANRKYDIAAELAKTGADRSQLCVKLTAIIAIRNILASTANVSDIIMNQYSWADKSMLELRNGQLNLPLALSPVPSNAIPVYSGACLIADNFSTLG